MMTVEQYEMIGKIMDTFDFARVSQVSGESETSLRKRAREYLKSVCKSATSCSKDGLEAGRRQECGSLLLSYTLESVWVDHPESDWADD